MWIRHLSLTDFRSWPAADLPLTPGVTVLVGRNGAGKTNLVEAAGYLATLSSHRVAGDAALIARGATTAVVRAAVVSQGRELLLETELTTGRPNKARINRSPLRRPRELLGVLRTVLFAPEDLALVRGDPSERRRFLDDLLVQRTPRLAGVRADYDRVLKQRNALLKSAGGRLRRQFGGRSASPADPDGSTAPGEPSTLDVWDQHLAETGVALVTAREELVEQLRPLVRDAYREVAGPDAVVDVRYRSTVPAALADAAPPTLPDGTVDDRTDDRADDRDLTGRGPRVVAMLEALTRRRADELDRGISLVGPHRDELELMLADGPAKGFASHGESWSYALALRIASFRLLRADGVDPVLILDDVFAELDSRRRDRLADLVADADQVLVTAAVAGDVPAGLRGRQIQVQDGTITVPEQPEQPEQPWPVDGDEGGR
ncbi:DNA replication/repair protein RecF [Nakamurella leprariae]|uniref:DNA replication and repair protein RecF n=1 Tax=Nakamurella leprariae TaxID=2803911 RepID=A0A939C3C9_9ACTN|nr:DNA replication/repair protein RecF [Nakamurella leprariae]MBM9468972.1 DNA replication/repair protein RecF [Nakamurella leprariae]